MRYFKLASWIKYDLKKPCFKPYNVYITIIVVILKDIIKILQFTNDI